MGKVIYLFGGAKKMAKYNVFAIAQWFLSKEEMTHKKLQKLCYYVYAWYYTLYNEHLFDGPFEGWIHGPVHRELYDEFKSYGWQPIVIEQEHIELEEDDIIFLEVIYDTFGEHSADELEEMTHLEEPWIEARKGLNSNEAGYVKINDETIKSFYSNLKNDNQLE